MPGILAIETSTDACSVATLHDGVIVERSVLAPRRHNQLLFPLLAELLDADELSPEHYAAIAYGSGPGSFTGLRIAASAVQGLCYGSGLPAVGISTLTALAQGALRQGVTTANERVCAVLDARIGEVYAAIYHYKAGLAILEAGPWACKPEALVIPEHHRVHMVGDGVNYRQAFSKTLQSEWLSCTADIWPMARDIAILAEAACNQGRLEQPHEVQPVYVRDEISWKKLPEQGRQT